MNKLEKFVNSPYFNSNQTLCLLFAKIKQDLPKKNLRTKQAYYKFIHKKDEYDDNKFRNYLSDLLKLLIEFLGLEQYKKDKVKKANNELLGVSKLGNANVIKSSLTSLVKAVDKSELQDGNYFLDSYLKEKSIFNLTNEYEKKRSAKKIVVNYLEINKDLDYFYLIEKLKWYVSYLSYRRLFKHNQSIQYIDVILRIVNEIGEDAPPALKIYYKIYLSETEEDNIQHFNDLKKLVYENYQYFNETESKDIFESLLNHTATQINKGKSEFLAEMLEIYELGIQSKMLLKNGELTPTSFRNICLIALRLKRFEWTTNFIEKNIHLVHEKYRDNAHKFNLARLYFYKKEYKNVIESIREVEFEDDLYTLTSKTMLLFSYYELEDSDTLVYFADSFNVYVKRNKSYSDRVRKEYLNLIKYAKKLTKARYNKSILPKLKTEILEEKSLASRQWFLDKLKNVKLPDEAEVQ